MVRIDGKAKLRMSEAPIPKATQVGGDHYSKMKIQPFDYIMQNNIGWAEGNAIKYLSRWKDKGGVEDLRKARHLIDMLIDFNTSA